MSNKIKEQEKVLAEDKVTIKEKLGYGGYFFGHATYYGLVTTFLMIFYTEAVGLDPLKVGFMFAIARLWDAINDPMMGIIADKFKIPNKKNARFLPWINMSVALLPLILVPLFSNPFADSSETIRLVYAYVTYIGFGMIYTLSDVPMFASSTVVSKNMNERRNYLLLGRLFAMFGNLIPAVVFPLLIEPMGYSNAAYLVIIVGFVFTVPFVFTGRERVIEDKRNTPKVADMIKFVFTNKYLISYFSSFFILRCLVVGGVAAPYFYGFVLESNQLLSISGFLGIFSAIILIVIAPALIGRVGKRNAYIAMNIFSLICSLVLFFIGYGSPMVVLILSVGGNLAVMASSVFMGLFVGDCIEYGQYTTGFRNEGISFAVNTFTNKASTAVQALLGGIILSFIGYVDQSSINDQVSNGLFSMMTIIPAVGVIISLIVFIVFYRLTEADVKMMSEENLKNNSAS